MLNFSQQLEDVLSQLVHFFQSNPCIIYQKQLLNPSVSYNLDTRFCSYVIPVKNIHELCQVHVYAGKAFVNKAK